MHGHSIDQISKHVVSKVSFGYMILSFLSLPNVIRPRGYSRHGALSSSPSMLMSENCCLEYAKAWRANNIFWERIPLYNCQQKKINTCSNPLLWPELRNGKSCDCSSSSRLLSHV